MVLDKFQGKLFSKTIFQCPSEMGKGVLVTPTVHENLMVGPNAIDADCKEDVSTSTMGLDEVRDVALRTTEKVNYRETIKNFAGLRAISSNNNFIIEENDTIKGFIDVAGMKSPGLTSAPSIAVYVVNILKEAGLILNKKKTFKSKRIQIRFNNLSDDEKNELIKVDSRYGNIVCRCEKINEGEIVDAIKRSFGSLSLDSVKRRCRPGMGRCQGGFCSPKVAQIIAREQHVELDEVILDKKGSWILSGKMK